MKSERDPRDSWDYILSKMQTDYRLLSKINIRGKTILNIGCGYPIDEIYPPFFVTRKISLQTLSRLFLPGIWSIVEKDTTISKLSSSNASLQASASMGYLCYKL